MRYRLLIIFFIFFIPCNAQQNSTPEFFLHDPIINKKGKLSIPLKYLKDFSFNQGLAEVVIKDSNNGDEKVRKGLINQKGKFVVSPDYIKINFSQYGIVALLDKVNKWNFYSIKEGKIKHGGFYDKYKIVSAGLVLISKDNRWGILTLNENAHIYLEPNYKNVDVVSENTINVNHFNSWELRDSSFKVLKQYSYDSLSFYVDSIMEYKLNAFVGYIDYSGKEVGRKKNIIGCKMKRDISGLDEVFERINSNNKCGMLNANGDTIIPAKYDRIIGPYENIFMVYKEDSVGIVDKSGEVLMELNKRFQEIFPFHEGRAMFVKASKYGFIDQRGNVRVAPQYTYIRNFNEGAAAVVIRDKWGFIDKDENIIVQPYYSEVLDFKNGIARVKIDGKWHFVNKKGGMLNQAYDEIKETNSDKWILIRNNKKGLADVNGRELLAPRYDYVQDLENGKIIVSKNGLYGILDYQENFIYPISVNYISYDEKNNLFLFMKKGKVELIEINDGNQR